MSELAQDAAKDDRVSSMPEVDKAAGRVSTESPKEMANHSETWKTMAPDVDEYNSSVARGIASGSGQIIRGIFWLSFMAVTQLENGCVFFEKKVKPSDTPSHISSQTIQILHRYILSCQYWFLLMDPDLKCGNCFLNKVLPYRERIEVRICQLIDCLQGMAGCLNLYEVVCSVSGDCVG
jgi:hypothetical protein